MTRVPHGTDAPESARGRRWIRLVPALLPLFVLTFSAWRGIDFGRHWDEHVQIEALETAIHTGRPLPGWYHYPSMCFWIGCAALAPDVLRVVTAAGVAEGHAGTEARKKELIERARSPAFRLRLRGWFLTIGSLAVLWTYLAGLATGSWPRALLAASLVAGSWEVGYHLRWIAPDAIAMQFGAATLACALVAARRGSRRWVWASALLAGAATSTKYPLGLLLVPVAVAALAVAGDRRRARAALLLGALALFAAAYLAITPGTVLEHGIFRKHLAFEAHHYRIGGHYGFTVEPGWDHLSRVLVYLGGAALSPYRALAWGLFGLALVGALERLARAPRTFLLSSSFPLAYLAYLVTLRVLFVRNWLVVIPFLALFAAHGAAVLVRAARPRPVRWLAVLALAAAVAANFAFQVAAGESIRTWTNRRGAEQLLAHLDAHPERTYRIFPRAAVTLERLGAGDRPNVREEGEADADAIVLYNRELPWAKVHSNRPGFAEAIFGPLEVNFDYYTSWPERRILVVPVETAREMLILP